MLQEQQIKFQHNKNKKGSFNSENKHFEKKIYIPRGTREARVPLYSRS